MECCFNHQDVEKEMSCFYCGKAFCKECLMLQGKRKTVICKDCLNYFELTLQKSRARRYILIGFGSILSAAALYVSSKYYSNYDPNATVFLILGLIGLAAVVFNFIRIRQIKDWLVTEEYSQSDRSGSID